MLIRDYQLLNNIEMLFQYPVIIYGAGKRGRQIEKLLTAAEIPVAFFCDSDSHKKEYLGYEVKFTDKLKNSIGNECYNIILASDIYFEEMKCKLDELNISNVNVFTAWGGEWYPS